MNSSLSSTNPPGTDTERVVTEVWCEVLALPRVGAEDNFFDLGGHSVLLHMVAEQLRRRLRRDVPLVELFRYPTVRALTRYLDGGADETPGTGRAPAGRTAGRRDPGRADRLRAARAGRPGGGEVRG